MNWEEFKESLSSWGVLRQTLKLAEKNLTDAGEAIKEMENGTQALLKHLRESQSRILDWQNRIVSLGWSEDDIKEVIGESLTEEVVATLRQGWEAVAEECDACMDSFNARGFYMMNG
jgi:hypothetical protein